MKSFFCLTGCIIFAYLLLTRPQEVILGTMTGGELCIDLLLPSLFPFMALSAFLARSGAGELLARPFLPITRFLSLPDASAPVLLASMIGGIPPVRRQFFLLQKRAVWKRRTPPTCCAAPSTPVLPSWSSPSENACLVLRR